MILSNNGVKFIADFEGKKLAAYKDIVGVVTIGYGHTGPDVKMGQVITEQQALDLLAKDVSKFATGVTQLVKVPITQNQFDALVSFSYNLGLNTFQHSSILRLINSGKPVQAAAVIKQYDHAGGKVVAGLTRRRLAETALFLKK